MTAGANERFIFTVATGRCGQWSLVELANRYITACYARFEGPTFLPFLPPPFDTYERNFRRRFIETNELLGRGKVLTAFDDGDYAFIEKIAERRLRTIRKEMRKKKATVYFDVSKFFARGLHAGFTRALERYAIVNLVRDPLSNMRSFLNREKMFTLDNNLPDAKSNMLRLDSAELERGEFYLWTWCELYLRFDKLRQLSGTTHALEIRTEDLESPTKMNTTLNALDLAHSPIAPLPPHNTNAERGFPATRVSADDIRLFERFMDRVPSALCDRIAYLKDYDPWAVHQVERAKTA